MEFHWISPDPDAAILVRSLVVTTTEDAPAQERGRILILTAIHFFLMRTADISSNIPKHATFMFEKKNKQ